MIKNKRARRRANPLLSTAKGIGGLLAALATAIGGWIGYSALAINHDMDLAPALDAERQTFESASAGGLSYYADRGGAGRSLVLIHSINAGASAYEMRPIFEHYRGQRPVYALDLPGFGFSERSDRVYSPALYASAIHEFIETQVSDKADVIALSLGSEFVARAAYERPDLFHSLALISPSGLSERNAENRVQSAGRQGSGDRLLRIFSFPLWSQAFYDLLVSPPSLRYFLSRSFVGPVDQGLLEYAYPTTHQPGARYAPLYFVSGKLFTPDIWQSVYQRLELPVLVIYDHDSYVSFELLPRALELPNWHGARITPTLGLPHFEKLPDVAHALDRFWRLWQEPEATTDEAARQVER